MVFFFQLIGLGYFGVLAVHRLRGRFGVGQVYMNITVGVLLVLGLVCKNNVSIAVRELVSGSAYRYDEELCARYRSIRECKNIRCVVPHLEHSSVSLRYDVADRDDPHVSDYFGKVVEVR